MSSISPRSAAKFYALFFCLFQLFGRCNTSLDLHCEVDLVGGSQKIDLADLLEVHAHRVPREHDRRGIDATGTGPRARRAGAGLLLARGPHFGLSELGNLDIVVLGAFVPEVVIQIVDIVHVVNIDGGIVAVNLRGNLDTMVAKGTVD